MLTKILRLMRTTAMLCLSHIMRFTITISMTCLMKLQLTPSVQSELVISCYYEKNICQVNGSALENVAKHCRLIMMH